MYKKYENESFGVRYSFNYVPSKIFGVGGLEYIDVSYLLEPYLDNINQEICEKLSDFSDFNFSYVTGEIPSEFKKEYHNKNFESETLGSLLKEPNNYDLQVLRKLTDKQRRKYLFFKNDMLMPWFFSFYIIENSFSNKTNKSNNKNILNEMPSLNQCVNNLPFKEIGRIVIYGSYPNNPVAVHRDKFIGNHKDHHINIFPKSRRPFYVYDSLNKTKKYVGKDTRAIIFNNRDYHGVDAEPIFNYTLRIDGKFTEEFCEQINLINGEFICG